MPYKTALDQLRVVIIDPNTRSANRLKTALCAHKHLMHSVEIATTIDDAKTLIPRGTINTIFLDPLSLGVDRTAHFVFDVRNRLGREIVFGLYTDLNRVATTKGFYNGEKHRWRHYFKIDKALKGRSFCGDVHETIHYCLSDIRLNDSLRRTQMQLNYLSLAAPPVEIRESLEEFREEHKGRRTAFIMMPFSDGKPHKRIFKAIKSILATYDIEALRADERTYEDDLLPNILTYIYGCDVGIAVFERISGETFNPNVSLEVGYWMALRKPICYLRDKTLPKLHSDLISKLYYEFDTYEPEKTIDKVMRKWVGQLLAKNLGTSSRKLKL
jgi:hypothetical protein